ncbi:hypothetical protein [Fluviicola sp.]|uniref:hypothetical protein n=1 Tax=Fluviicola sp. TaxID=1917219 RepID=UPI0031E36991
MFENTKPRIGQELLDVPMGDMIRQMAFAIAEAQIVLDQNSIDVAEMMGGLTTVTDEEGNVTFEDSRVYFGREKLTKAQAIARHNSTTNVQEKAEIRSLLGSGAYKPTLLATPSGFTAGAAIGTADKYVDFQGSFYLSTGTGGTGPSVAKTHGDLMIESTTTSTDGSVIIELPRRISMLECGFTPTFYQFVDTIIEVKISIKYTQEGTAESSGSVTVQSPVKRIGKGLKKLKNGKTVQIAQVNAAYSQKYSYSAEGSSLLRTKLVPLPPPSILEERIQRMINEEYNNVTPAAIPAP